MSEALSITNCSFSFSAKTTNRFRDSKLLFKLWGGGSVSLVACSCVIKFQLKVDEVQFLFTFTFSLGVQPNHPTNEEKG